MSNPTKEPTNISKAKAPARPSVLYCPVGKVFSPCELSELDAVVEHLKSDAAVKDQAIFPRGTHLADGRLDLCKQSIGPLGTHAIAAALESNTQTKHWLLGANGLGDEGAKSVAKTAQANKQLETIYLGCNLIQSDGATDLANALIENEHVTGLWLKRNPIGPEGAAQIANMLRSNSTLRTLDLVHTQIGEDGLKQICQSLSFHDAPAPHTNPKTNTSIKRLYLGGNKIDAALTLPICEMIRSNRSIHSLYLSVNRLGDDGANLIAQAVAENEYLETISLSANDIGPDGAWSIVEQLQYHPTLRCLDLGDDKSAPVLGEKRNRIGDLGCAAIGELLRSNRTLRVLDLQGNGISSAGAQILADALESNRNLTALRLGKGIGRSQKKRILELLARNARRLPAFVETDASDIKAIKSVYRTPVAGVTGVVLD